MTTENIEKSEEVYGSLSEVINKLLIKSVGDKNYLNLITAILQVIRDSIGIFADFKISVKKVGDEFMGLFEYEQNLYIVFSYMENSDPYKVNWLYLEADLIKPFLPVS